MTWSSKKTETLRNKAAFPNTSPEIILNDLLFQSRLKSLPPFVFPLEARLWDDGWRLLCKNKLDGILSYYLWFLDLPTEFLINIWIIYSNLQRHFNSAYGRGKRVKNVFVSLRRGRWTMTQMIACLICNYSWQRSSFSGRNFQALGPNDYGSMRIICHILTRGQTVMHTKLGRWTSVKLMWMLFTATASSWFQEIPEREAFRFCFFQHTERPWCDHSDCTIDICVQFYENHFS